MISPDRVETKAKNQKIKSSPNKIKVLIVDDGNFVREYLKHIIEIESELEVVGTAHNGENSLNQVKSLQPDIVLMDLSGSKIDGINATRATCKQFPEVKVLVLSSFDNKEYIAAALQIGAMGYLPKNTPAEKLIAAIKAIHDGSPQIAPEVYKNIIELLDQPNDLVTSEVTVDPEHNHNLPKYPDHIKNRLKLYSILTLLLVSLLTVVGTKSKINWFGIFPAFSISSQENNPVETQISENLLSVKATRIEPIDSYQVTRSYTGKIVANRSSELSFETAGKLIDLQATEGDHVEPGTPLATLDTRNLQTRKRELEARKAQAVARLQELQLGSRQEDITSAQAVVNRWQQQLKLERRRSSRRKSLYGKGAISLEQLDEAVTSESSIQAQLDEAQSQLKKLQTGARPETIVAQQATVAELDASLDQITIELEKSVLKAPFSGIISTREVDEGTVVSSGQTVFKLVENNTLEARIGIPVNRAERVKIDDTLPLTIGQKTYQGRVTSLLPELDADTLTVTVFLALENSANQSVVAGQLARLELSQTIATSGYWLPTTALVKSDRSLWFSYVLREHTPDHREFQNPDVFTVERRTVEVLHTESDRVLVRGTLKPGEKVITNGLHRLVPGQLVIHQSL